MFVLNINHTVLKRKRNTKGKVFFLVQIKPEIKESIVCETFKTIDMAISSNAF